MLRLLMTNTFITADLLSVLRSNFGGDLCTEPEAWTHDISWTTEGGNDSLFQIDIEVSTEASPSSFSGLVTGLSSLNDNYLNDTGISGNINGVLLPETHYRTYRVKLIRKSDSSVIEQADTDTGQITIYTDLCV